MKKLILTVLTICLSACSSTPKTAVSVLEGFNRAYETKNVDAFMANISERFQGNRDDLKLAVENDFAAFDKIEYRTDIGDVEMAENKVFAEVVFFRSARTAAGSVDNQSGRTTLGLIEEDGGLKLWKMPYPPLYGMIEP